MRYIIVACLLTASGLAYSLASHDAERVGQTIQSRDAALAALMGE